MHAPVPNTPLVVIVGPTAAGKTGLSLALARRCGAEIVSADSQQVYKGMDVGTGKVSIAARQEIRHHVLDVLTPDRQMTAARFVALADAAIAGAASRGAPVVIVGGTGLYVRALMFGLFDGPPADPAIRARLVAAAEADGTGALWARLRDCDADAAARIDATDQRRIVRALEVWETTGIPISVHQARHDFRRLAPRYPARLVGVDPGSEALAARIEARVDAMMAAGLLDEVRGLRAAGYHGGLRSQAAIGYAELHSHLDGDQPLAEAVRKIKRNSRRYARRQRSWYRGDERVVWHREPSDVDLEALERYLRSMV